jgi:hypothetical protein
LHDFWNKGSLLSYMRRIISKMPLLFLWLAGLAVVAHMVVPHDHHQSDVNFYQDGKCPASEKDNGHGPGIPLHCNSLNDLTSEKAIKFTVPEQLRNHDLVLFASSDLSLVLSEVYCIKITETGSQLPDPDPDSSPPLRAPPSFC